MIKFLFITLFFLPSIALATTYYVDGNLGADCAGGAGTSYRVTERDCAGSDGTKAYDCVADVNSVLVAGDIAYVRGSVGSYQEYNIGAIDSATEGIDPDNSGTNSLNRITYSVYPGEMVHFIGNHALTKMVNIIDQDWIKITGYDGSTNTMNWKFSNFYWGLYIRSASSTGGAGSSYNEVSHCQFTDNVISHDSRGSTIYRNSEYNWIHHCEFSNYGSYSTSSSSGETFELGNEHSDDDPADSTQYNVIEDCNFFGGGHHLLGLHENYNVVRNNNFHNERWWYDSGTEKYYGYRSIYMAGVDGSYHGYNMLENNRISHSAGNLHTGNNGGSGISLNQANAIIRYNSFYANGLGGIYYQCGGSEDCDAAHIYNNSWLSNGYLTTLDLPALGSSDIKRRSITVWTYPVDWTNYENIRIKNNIFYKNVHDGDQIETNDTFPAHTTIANNWNDGGDSDNGDPKYTDLGSYSSPSIGDCTYEGCFSCDPTDDTDPNLNLQSDSPCIDNGTWLTQANGSGSDSTTLIVDDAGYFQSGWGDGAGGSASVEADWIAIGTVGNVVQISSINYGTNTITLSSAMTWSDDANIWLYKDSDGTIVLFGSAPDQGAHEYSPEGRAVGVSMFGVSSN